MAGGGGLEPPLPGPEPGVLPLDEPPAATVIVRGGAAGCQGRTDAELADGLSLQMRLERAARLEARHPARGDLDGLAGPRIAAVALGPPAHQEGAEAADGHLPAAAERIEHVVEQGIERLLGGDLRAAGGLRHRGDELGLDHGTPYYASARAEVKRSRRRSPARRPAARA